MRRFLLGIGCLVVGFFTVMSVFAGFTAPSDQLPGIVGGWAVVLVFGMILSAPFFLNPPPDSNGWSMRLPLFLWVLLMIFKALSATGWYILLGAWWLIFRVWRRGNSAGLPGAPALGTAPVLSQPPAPSGPVAPTPAAPPKTPGWYADPAGRHELRQWTGAQWTTAVMDWGRRGTDPLP